MVVWGFIAVALLALYAFRVEPFRLTVVTESVGRGDTAIRLVQLSDLEISRNYTEEQLPAIVKAVNEQSPDVIVFTGDLFSNFSQYRPIEQVEQALTDMIAPLGKFAVWGNNDYGGGAAQEYRRIMEQAGFTLLCNSGQEVVFEGKSLYIAGLDETTFGAPDIDEIKAGGVHDYTVLLAHEPSLSRMVTEYDADLMLTGHTHGGQVRLPFADELGLGEGSRYLRGMYELENEAKTQLYVHSGMGTSRYAVRFLVPPQIAVFDIGLE